MKYNEIFSTKLFLILWISLAGVFYYLYNNGTSVEISLFATVFSFCMFIIYGVQEVSSVFLSFFAENPVDYVEVNSFCKYGDDCPSQGAYDKQHLCKVEHSIIFPQKETEKKGNWEFERSSGYSGYRNTETNQWVYQEDYLKMFGEKTYTKEDLKRAFEEGGENTIYDDMYGYSSSQTFEQWFNTFKTE